MTDSKALIDFSLPTNNGVVTLGKTTMSLSGRTGNDDASVITLKVVINDHKTRPLCLRYHQLIGYFFFFCASF